MHLLELKLLIKKLQHYCSSTSLISLSIPCEDKEYVTSSLENRLAFITEERSRNSFSHTLELLKKIEGPLHPNGLLLYAGIGRMTTESLEMPISFSYVPFKRGLRLDSSVQREFKTKFLQDLLDSEDRYGFFLVGWNRMGLTTVSGNFVSFLPDVHLSERILMQGGHRQVEYLAQTFLENFWLIEALMGCTWLIFGSPFDIDSALMECLKMLPDRRTLLKIFASRIFKKVLKECSIVYGGQFSFDEALNQSVDILGNDVIVIQKRMLKEYLELVANKDARCVVHIESIMKLLELNFLGVVFLWNELDLVAFELQDITTGARKMEYKKQGEELDIRGNFVIISKQLVLERVLQLCRTRDIQLVLAAKEHQEGSMFYRSQHGIGAILKAKEEICKLLEEEKDEKGA